VFRSAALVIAVAVSSLGLGLAACKGDAAADQPTRPAGTKSVVRPPVVTNEQERFDQEREPARVVQALGLKPGMIIADVGAGTGLLTVHLARAVAPAGRVVATDVDGAVLDMLETRMVDAGLASVVERRVVAGDVPGLETATYDAILLSEVDHYFSDRVAWLKAAIPALKPGGRLVITNRTYHRAPAMEAAQAAGLHLDQEVTEVPGEFIATFSVAKGSR
jgi:ubiquinone/menaquinone biosynthesis C-methylase UbiE